MALAANEDYQAARDLVDETDVVGTALSTPVRHLRTRLLANLALAAGDTGRAREHAFDALACAQGDAASATAALYTLSRIAMVDGDWAAAGSHLQQAIDEYAGPHDLPGIAILMVETGWARAEQGDTDGANRAFGRALRLARRQDFPESEAWIRYGQAVAHMLNGEHDKALRYLDHGSAIYKGLGNLHGQALGHAARGFVEDHRGDHNAAQPHYRRCLETGRGEAAWETLSYGFDGMALAHHRGGDDLTSAILLGASTGLRGRARLTRPMYSPGTELAPLLRERLGEQAWAQAQQDGAALTLDEAIDLAVQ
jgi:tetratricopeptide (TPR) repeat protein